MVAQVFQIMVIVLLKKLHITQLSLIYAMKVTFCQETRLELAMVTEHGLGFFQNVNVSLTKYQFYFSLVIYCVSIFSNLL